MINFLNLKEINNKYSSRLYDVAKKVISSGVYINGQELRKFENNFANFCNVNHCIGVSNGLDALELILMAYLEKSNIKVGDEVIIPSHTFIATALAVNNLGLKPIFVEPNPKTFNIEPALIKKSITKKTKALIVVHLYGMPCDMNPIMKLAKENKLIVIEDCAQAHGAKYNGNLVGSIGHAAAFSFYPAKTLGALGDGGCITTNDSEIADITKMLSNYGSKTKYYYKYKGRNNRLDELQAGFLNIKLNYVDEDIKKRNKVAKFYLENIKNPLIKLPYIPTNISHAWHLFIIKVKDYKVRKKFQNYLKLNGVETGIHYPIPIHKQSAFIELNQKKLEIAESLSNTVLSLPIYTTLTQKQVKKICCVINDFHD